MVSSIHIPLTSDHEYTLHVWCDTGPMLPKPEALRRTYFEWLRRYCDEPFRSALQTWVEKRPLNIRVVGVGRVPAPPLSALRQAGSGEAEEARLTRATHEIAVGARDRHEPHLALWNVLGMAHSIAVQFGGVVMDRDVPRLIPINTYTSRPESEIRVTEHILVLAVPQREGRAHLVARGMRKFQLPSIEVEYVPRELQPHMALVIQILAQMLVYRVHKLLASRWPSGHHATLAIPNELRLDLDHESLRKSRWKVKTKPNARRATEIRLAFLPDNAPEPLLRLEPPDGFRGDPRGWMAPMLAELLGEEEAGAASAAEAEPEPADPLEAAHQRALKDLPELKRRFQKGLPGGHDAYVKRAFPLPDGGHEYMWIHVTSWFEDVVRGKLATHPRHRTDLRAGQTLQCTEEDVFDWLLVFPDGREMGGFTDKVSQQRKVPRPIPF